MGRIVKAKELRTKGTVALARWLLGKYLVRRHPDGRVEARPITEVEAYDGEHDLASHARAGRTARTEVMYADGGVWYVYLCYGVHEMLNLVVGPRDRPAAILIRGVEGIAGPGRLTRALGIDRKLNAAAIEPEAGLWIEDRGTKVARRDIRTTARIGVDYAGPVWAKKPWRFVIEQWTPLLRGTAVARRVSSLPANRVGRKAPGGTAAQRGRTQRTSNGGSSAVGSSSTP